MEISPSDSFLKKNSCPFFEWFYIPTTVSYNIKIKKELEMGLVITFAVVFALIALIAYISESVKDKKFDLAEFIFGVAFSGVVGAIGGIILVGVLSSLFLKVDTVDVVIETKPIVTLADKSDVNGSLNGNFLFVSGSLVNDTKYSFYQLEDDGGMVWVQIPSNLATVYYDNNPRVVTNGKLKVCDIRGYAAFFLLCFESTSPSDITYDLFVPEGSVTSEFKLDGQ